MVLGSFQFRMPMYGLSALGRRRYCSWFVLSQRANGNALRLILISTIFFYVDDEAVQFYAASNHATSLGRVFRSRTSIFLEVQRSGAKSSTNQWNEIIFSCACDGISKDEVRSPRQTGSSVPTELTFTTKIKSLTKNQLSSCSASQSYQRRYLRPRAK